MSLTAEQARRLGGLAGILFVVIALVALFLPGSPPKADEVDKIAPFFTDKRGSILASNYLLGLAFAFFLLFLGSLRAQLGAAGREGTRPGSAALAGGVAAVALVLAGTAVLNAAVFRVADAGDANLNLALYDVSNDLFFMSSFAFAAFFAGAALAIASTGALPSALAPAGLVVALISVVSAVGLFAKSGFFAIGGAAGFIVPLASLIWVIAASIAMLRAAPEPRPGHG
jgi:hypothetical protein